jgi:hypothetical protein
MATSYQLTGPTQRRLPATAEAANLNPTPQSDDPQQDQ